MAIATSYNVTSVQGAREDLSDQLKRVSPEQCPVFSTLSQSRSPKALLSEWMVDSLGEPVFATPPVDGADLSFNAGFADEISTRVRMGNRIQQVQRPFAVSRLAEKIDVAGPQSNLYGASAAKALILLKTDIESAICSSQLPQTGTDAVGDKLGGLKHWTDPTATTGVFDTSAKQNFRSVTGSRFDYANSGGDDRGRASGSRPSRLRSWWKKRGVHSLRRSRRRERNNRLLASIRRGDGNRSGVQRRLGRRRLAFERYFLAQ
jgi:hypothetical protein